MTRPRTLMKQLLPAPLHRAWTMRHLTQHAQGEAFGRIGRAMLRTLIDVGGLQPDERVLDVGCGLGRIALPLAGYLSAAGSYEGFDILQGEIEWARRHISAKHPNFRFQHVSLWNEYYGVQTEMKARDFRFPFADAEFNLVFLSSVFTHMLRLDVEHYLDEIQRVLRPGGRCVMTFFLLHDERRRLGGDYFAFQADGCKLRSETSPEWEVAYEEADVRRMCAQSGLRVERVLSYGGQDGGQDVILATRVMEQEAGTG